MLNSSRSSSVSKTFRPIVEALEDRLVPAGGFFQAPTSDPVMAAKVIHRAEAPQPVVALTQESGSALVTAPVVGAPEGPVDQFIRLRRIVSDTPQTQPEPEMARAKEFFTHLGESMSHSLQPMEQVSLNFAKAINR